MVAVGDDDLTRRQRGHDDLGDQLAAGGHEQVHLGLGVDLEALVEQHVPDLLAQLGAAGLPHDHGVAFGEPLAQQLGLGRFARAFGALERDEQPAPAHVREL